MFGHYSFIWKLNHDIALKHELPYGRLHRYLCRFREKGLVDTRFQARDTLGSVQIVGRTDNQGINIAIF